MKKKIFIVALVVCIMAISIASASIAYFTDTETATNTFTSGDVAIALTETQYDVNGAATVSTVGVDGFTGYNYGTVYPGFTYDKYPTITNTGSEDAYLGAKIVITNVNPQKADVNITDVLTVATAEGKTLVSDFLSNNVFANGDYSVEYVTKSDSIEIYVVYQKATATSDSIKLFDEVVVPAGWDNDEMADLEAMNIVITAYAVQTAGFATADAAFQAAFGTEFAPYFA